MALEILDVVNTGVGALQTIIKSICDIFGKGKMDVTEKEKLRVQLELKVQEFEFEMNKLKSNIGLQWQQSLIDLEKMTNAKWRMPVIVSSWLYILLTQANNMLDNSYFPQLQHVEFPYFVLVIFLFLIGGGRLDEVFGMVSKFSKLITPTKKPEVKEREIPVIVPLDIEESKEKKQ